MRTLLGWGIAVGHIALGIIGIVIARKYLSWGKAPETLMEQRRRSWLRNRS